MVLAGAPVHLWQILVTDHPENDAVVFRFLLIGHKLTNLWLRFRKRNLFLKVNSLKVSS